MKPRIADVESETDSAIEGSVSAYSQGEPQIDSYQSALPNTVITSRAEGASSSGGYTVSCFVALRTKIGTVYLSRYITLKCGLNYRVGQSHIAFRN